MENFSSGKTIVVTGATSGIGLAAAEQLAQAGVTVIGIGRSEERCRASEARLKEAHPSGEAQCLLADLSRQDEVRSAAAAVQATLAGMGRGGLDGLLNNAGGFNFRRSLTPDGYERTWAVNHLAPFLLTNLLLPLLEAAPAARVVTVSSNSHYGSRMRWGDLQRSRYGVGFGAYGQSKLANVLFTLELNRRLGAGSRVQVFAADPGLVRTGIARNGSPRFVAWAWSLWARRGMDPRESARGIVKLLLDPGLRTSAGIYWKHGEPKAPDPAALDAEAARRLWKISAEMCGMAPGEE